MDDDCLLGVDNCSPDATCTDTDDGFECTCNPGFTGDGVECTGQWELINTVDLLVIMRTGALQHFKMYYTTY